jgi:hypothetical protein
MNSTGLLAAECEVSSWSSTIGLLMDARNKKQASESCIILAELAGKNGLAFDMQWKIQIHSPRGGKEPLAVCVIEKHAPTARALGLRPGIGN